MIIEEKIFDVLQAMNYISKGNLEQKISIEKEEEKIRVEFISDKIHAAYFFKGDNECQTDPFCFDLTEMVSKLPFVMGKGKDKKPLSIEDRGDSVYLKSAGEAVIKKYEYEKEKKVFGAKLKPFASFMGEYLLNAISAGSVVSDSLHDKAKVIYSDCLLKIITVSRTRICRSNIPLEDGDSTSFCAAIDNTTLKAASKLLSMNKNEIFFIGGNENMISLYSDRFHILIKNGLLADADYIDSVYKSIMDLDFKDPVVINKKSLKEDTASLIAAKKKEMRIVSNGEKVIIQSDDMYKYIDAETSSPVTFGVPCDQFKDLISVIEWERIQLAKANGLIRISPEDSDEIVFVLAGMINAK